MIEEKNKSSNRSFGIVFFLLFLIIGIYPIFNANGLRLWSLIISLIFLILGLTNSKILTPLNKAWFKFGIILGKVFSPVIMAAIFFLVVTPTGLIMRLLKKNILNLKFNQKNTYWIDKKGPKSIMKNQF